MQIKRILCPIDFSEASDHAVDQAAVIAGYYKAGITALHVLTPLTLAMSGVAMSAEAEGEVGRLRRLAAEEFAAATAKGIGVDVVVDPGNRPA